MTEPLVCAKCGHTEDDHDPLLGICEIRNCTCILFRTDDDPMEDEEDGFEPLDFDHPAA